MSIITGNGGRRHWRQKELRDAILLRVQGSFEAKERRIREENGRKFREFEAFLIRNEKNRERDPKRYDLAEERQALFDKAVKRLIGQFLANRKVVIGCIAHGELSFTNVMRHIDRSIVVCKPDGSQVRIFNFDVTGPGWVRKKLMSSTPSSKIGIVPVRTTTERDGQPERVTIEQIQKDILGFINSN